MTLETARRIVDEGIFNKEAEAVVRGGMTICEVKTDGSRAYHWIKVRPTANDGESSIEMALGNHQKMKNKRQASTISKREELVTHKTETTPVSNNPSSTKEVAPLPSQPSLLERLKNKAVEIWNEIDSIVIE